MSVAAGTPPCTKKHVEHLSKQKNMTSEPGEL